MTSATAQETTERTYYAVPTHYTIGSEHEDLSEAVAAAKAKVRRFFYQTTKAADFRPGGHRWEDGGLAMYSRAFVERRVSSDKGDHPVERIEVFLTDGEKDALRKSQAAA